MIRPQALKKGDTVAIVSLSFGMAGEKIFRHRYELGKRRLEEVFGLNVVTMPNALRGIDYLFSHPKARAQDLMDAFSDPSIKAIICNVGGDDTVRLLPYIDYDMIRNNPKIFMGYSDTTVNHFMMYKAGLVSFYGPAVLCEFAENQCMHDYTVQSIHNTLFEGAGRIELTPSPLWTSEFLEWSDESNNNIQRELIHDEKGFEVLQGSGTAEGDLLGGCVDVFPIFMGTDVWPKKEEWQDKIVFLESSEDYPEPILIKYTLRNMAAQGIIERIKGVLIGKPKDEKYYNEYKEMYTKFFSHEAGRPDLPIIYNMNFGHTAPMCILPYGTKVSIDCEKKSVAIVESPVVHGK